MGTEVLKREDLPTQVAAKVRREIFTGLLREGDRLPPEKEVAERYGVSRVSVRQALQELEREGWVEIVQGRGATVRGFRDAVGLDALPALLVSSPAAVVSPGMFLTLFEFSHWMYRMICVSAAEAGSVSAARLKEITSGYAPGVSAAEYVAVEEAFYREMLSAGGDIVLGMFFNTYIRTVHRLVEGGVLKAPPLSRDLYFAFNEELAAAVGVGDVKRIDAAFVKYSPLVRAELARYFVSAGLHVAGA